MGTWWFKVTFLGWLSDPLKGVKWPPTRGSKGHFESPGIDFFLLGSNLPIIEAGSTFPARGFSFGGGLVDESI